MILSFHCSPVSSVPYHFHNHLSGIQRPPVSRLFEHCQRDVITNSLQGFVELNGTLNRAGSPAPDRPHSRMPSSGRSGPHKLRPPRLGGEYHCALLGNLLAVRGYLGFGFPHSVENDHHRPRSRFGGCVYVEQVGTGVGEVSGYLHRKRDGRANGPCGCRRCPCSKEQSCYYQHCNYPRFFHFCLFVG